MSLAVYPWQEKLAPQLAALREKLPSSLLFYGPRGTGTFELAERFAKSLFCSDPHPDGTACGRCPDCLLIASGNHPDLRYILSEAEALPRELPYTPAGSSSAAKKNLTREILIHQPRSLSDFVGLTAHSGKRRAILVYPADRIREDAASVFLKMMEEPPEGCVFILAAEDVDAVLPTIRSRSRLVPCPVPSKTESLDWLRCQGIKDPEKALVKAGGMPLSVAETDQSRVMDEDDAEALLGLLRLSGGTAGAESRITAGVGRDWKLPAAAVLLSRWSWDLAAAAAGLPPRYFPEEKETLAALSRHLNKEAFFAWQDSLKLLSALSGHPVNAKLSLEQTLFSYIAAFS